MTTQTEPIPDITNYWFSCTYYFQFNIESFSQKAAIRFPAFNSKYVNTSSFRQVVSHSFLTFSASHTFRHQILSKYRKSALIWRY